MRHSVASPAASRTARGTNLEAGQRGVSCRLKIVQMCSLLNIHRQTFGSRLFSRFMSGSGSQWEPEFSMDCHGAVLVCG